jgi:hypothetical protein
MELKSEIIKVPITKQVETGEFQEGTNYQLFLTEAEERSLRDMLIQVMPPEQKAKIGPIAHVMIMDAERHNVVFPVKIQGKGSVAQSVDLT